MPRVTDKYRAARRDEIAQAALRCLERKGVRGTSIADIVEESGLSTGAIYSHFSNKAELARYIVSRFLLPRVDGLEGAGRRGEQLHPRTILTTLMRAVRDEGLPPALVLQFWAEATVDAEMRAEVFGIVGRLRAALETAALPWAHAEAARRRDGVAPEAIATATIGTLVAIAQGYIANSAMFGVLDPDEYLTAAARALSA